MSLVLVLSGLLLWLAAELLSGGLLVSLVATSLREWRDRRRTAHGA